jgi:hypothetical protein
MATTGRKSELDVYHTFHFYLGMKDKKLFYNQERLVIKAEDKEKFLSHCLLTNFSSINSLFKINLRDDDGMDRTLE